MSSTKGKNPSAVKKNTNRSEKPASEKKEITEAVITLISSDGREFPITESAATLSVTIKEMLNPGSDCATIPLEKVDGETLATVVAYLINEHAAAGDQDKKKKFYGGFLSNKTEINVLFDVVLAANYLNIPGLMDLVSGKIEDRINNKSVEWVRKAFGTENDLTGAEVAETKSQYPWAWEGVQPDEEA